MSLVSITTTFSRSSVWGPLAALLIAMLSIQAGASLAKSLFPLVGAPAVTAMRLGLGAVILCFIFRPWRLRFSREQRLPLLIYGLALGGMNYCFYLSLRTIPLGIAVALEFTGPLIVAMAGSRKVIDFVWIILAVLGMSFLLPLGQSFSGIDPQGAMFALIAGACWAIYILSGRRAGCGHGPATVAAGSAIAAFVFVPLGISFTDSHLWFWALIPSAIAIAILSSALPYALEMVALTRLPARTFGTLTSLEPAVGAVAGMLFLGEALTLSQWLALVAIIIASAGSTLTMRNQKNKLQSIDTNTAQ